MNQSSGIAGAIKEFISLEQSGGVLLLFAAIAAMLIANSPLAGLYDTLLDTTVAVQVGDLAINKPVLLWINDGLMAIFFFLIGLEIKREVLDGELSSLDQVILPAAGAVGGMLVPAAIYVGLNQGDAAALNGWAIPVATDIAFALALLSTFGSRVPVSLKIFLLSLAIFDDLAAIVIIAMFYSADLSVFALLFGVLTLMAGIAMNRAGVIRTSAYILTGIILWVAVLKSGVHATLAGVLIAFCIPMSAGPGKSPLKDLEHDLHGPVAYVVLPIFAFANAGISFSGVNVADLLDPVPLGIVSGLLLGKPIGILLFVGIAVASGLATLPRGVRWSHLLGVALTCGIGFTMSLFIAGLAFEHGDGEYYAGDRLGIVVGSLLSAIAAYIVLQIGLPRDSNAQADSTHLS